MLEMFVLAVIQSITEFLPISSSGHLLLAEAFGFSHQTLAVDVALHIGTLAAVMVYFHKDIWSLIQGLWQAGENRALLMRLIIATLPVVVAGAFLHSLLEAGLRTPLIVAINAIVFGIVLWAADYYAPRAKTLKNMSYRDALWIGIAQTIALIPGVSRSGITITAARFLGINRTQAARFSMLLSIPTIALGGLYMLWQTARHGTLNTLISADVGIGMALTGLFGLLAVWFLMKWVKTASFAIFAIYRILLGIGLILYFF